MTPPGVDDLLRFLALRAVPGVEAVDVEAGTYARAVGGRVVVVGARDWAAPASGRGARGCAGGPDEVAAAGGSPRGDDRDPLASAALARTLLGDPGEVAAAAAHLGRHPVLGPVVRRAPGRLVPGHPDGAELAVRAVLGQQVSVAAARTLAGRLADELGEPVTAPSAGVVRSFPPPSALAALDPEALPMPRARGRALVGLAVALAAGDVDLSPGADVGAARAEMLALRGIGPWTADYVVMRALRAPDVLLTGDLGVVHALRGLGADTSRTALRRLAEEVSPYGSFATVHLWGTLGGSPG